MPLYDWSSYSSEDFQKLENLMKIVGTLFSFNLVSDNHDSESLFDLSLPFLRNFVIHKMDITNYVKKLSEANFEKLKIEKVYLSNYAIEFISTKESLISSENRSLIYDIIKNTIKDYCSDEILYLYSDSVNIKYIICDDINELNLIKSSYDLKEYQNGIFIGDENSNKIYNDILYDFWGKYIEFKGKNPIAFLKIDQLEQKYGYRGLDSVGRFISVWYGLGFIHILTESINSLSGSLEYSTWFLDNIFNEYEKNLCYLQKNILSQNRNVTNKIRKIQDHVKYILKYTSGDSFQRISRTYGEYFPTIISDSLGIINNAEEYGYSLSYEEIKIQMSNSLNELSKTLKIFHEELNISKNNWLKIHADTIMNNKFIITMLASLLTLFLTALSIIRTI